MRKMLRLALGSFFAMYMCACSASPCASALHVVGENINGVSGILRKETHWGPPNFGENPKTDSKFSAWVLHLDAPLTVAYSKSEKGVGVSDIQLESSSAVSIEQIAALENKHIVVNGLVWKATTPGDVTDFHIDVTKATVGNAVGNLACAEGQ